MTERVAHGGTLVVGGGFAGGYVARLLGKRGETSTFAPKRRSCPQKNTG
jgi:flavin-dependent dehydrogenase